MLTTLLLAFLSFIISIHCQSSSACGPITFTTDYGPLFVENSGNLTVPYDNNTALPGPQSGSPFYIGTDSSMSVMTPNGTTLYCHPFIWMQCTQTLPQNQSSSSHNFTIGSDGLLYVSENSDFYLATEFSETTDRPYPSHLYPGFQGTFGFTNIGGRLWGWTTVQLKASGCYAGHKVDDQTAPTPAASHGSSVDNVAAKARPIYIGLGAALLGLAAFL